MENDELKVDLMREEQKSEEEPAKEEKHLAMNEKEKREEGSEKEVVVDALWSPKKTVEQDS